jgi:hypothetical protein
VFLKRSVICFTSPYVAGSIWNQKTSKQTGMQQKWFILLCFLQCKAKPWQLAYILLGQPDVQVKGQGMSRLGGRTFQIIKGALKKNLKGNI